MSWKADKTFCNLLKEKRFDFCKSTKSAKSVKHPNCRISSYLRGKLFGD